MAPIEFRLRKQVCNPPSNKGKNNTISKGRLIYDVAIDGKTFSFSAPLVIRRQHLAPLNKNIELSQDVFNRDYIGNIKQLFHSPDHTLEVLMRSRIGTLHHYFGLVEFSQWHDAIIKIWKQLLIISRHWHRDLQIAHRDLKTHNIVVGSDGILRLIDFDSVRKFDAPHLAGVIDPEHLPPELHMIGKPRDYDYRSHDAWSIAMILIASMQSRGIVKRTLKFNATARMEDKKQRLQLMKDFSIHDELEEFFSADNLQVPYPEVIWLREILVNLMGKDWGRRLQYLQLQQDILFNKNLKLTDVALFTFNPPLKDFLRGIPKRIANREDEVSDLKTKKANLQSLIKHTANHRDDDPRALDTLNLELDQTKLKLAITKHNHLILILSSFMHEKQNHALSLFFDPKGSHGMSILECRMNNLLHYLMMMTLRDSTVHNRFFDVIDKPTSYDYKDYAIGFDYYPPESFGCERLQVCRLISPSPSQETLFDEANEDEAVQSAESYQSCSSTSSRSSSEGETPSRSPH